MVTEGGRDEGGGQEIGGRWSNGANDYLIGKLCDLTAQHDGYSQDCCGARESMHENLSFQGEIFTVRRKSFSLYLEYN